MCKLIFYLGIGGFFRAKLTWSKMYNNFKFQISVQGIIKTAFHSKSASERSVKYLQHTKLHSASNMKIKGSTVKALLSPRGLI